METPVTAQARRTQDYAKEHLTDFPDTPEGLVQAQPWKALGFAALLGVALAMVLASAAAQDGAPDALIRGITDDVLATVRADKALQVGDGAKLTALVQSKILPHFDFRRITELAAGPAWRRATPEQRDQLTAQFQTLLVRTYSHVLASYRDQAIDVLPVHMDRGDVEATVRCRVRQSGTAPIEIDYSVERSDSGWKVFDVVVDGVSLVLNYRSSFAQIVDQDGIDALIASLGKKNAG
jgi:phospholipid transport system substrate-binding protein